MVFQRYFFHQFARSCQSAFRPRTSGVFQPLFSSRLSWLWRLRIPLFPLVGVMAPLVTAGISIAHCDEARSQIREGLAKLEFNLIKATDRRQWLEEKTKEAHDATEKCRVKLVKWQQAAKETSERSKIVNEELELASKQLKEAQSVYDEMCTQAEKVCNEAKRLAHMLQAGNTKNSIQSRKFKKASELVVAAKEYLFKIQQAIADTKKEISLLKQQQEQILGSEFDTPDMDKSGLIVSNLGGAMPEKAFELEERIDEKVFQLDTLLATVSGAELNLKVRMENECKLRNSLERVSCDTRDLQNPTIEECKLCAEMQEQLKEMDQKLISLVSLIEQKKSEARARAEAALMASSGLKRAEEEYNFKEEELKSLLHDYETADVSYRNLEEERERLQQGLKEET